MGATRWVKGYPREDPVRWRWVRQAKMLKWGNLNGLRTGIPIEVFELMTGAEQPGSATRLDASP